jgi:hypothetical protein
VHGNLAYHDGGVSATGPGHVPDGDAAWCARPSKETTGRMRFASHSPPATVKWTPSLHRACTPSTVAANCPAGDSHEPASMTVTLLFPEKSRWFF